MKNHFARHATAALALAALTVPAALMAEDIGLIRPQARPLAETAATPEPAPAAPGTEARDSAGAAQHLDALSAYTRELAAQRRKPRGA